MKDIKSMLKIAIKLLTQFHTPSERQIILKGIWNVRKMLYGSRKQKDASTAGPSDFQSDALPTELSRLAIGAFLDALYIA